MTKKKAKKKLAKKQAKKVARKQKISNPHTGSPFFEFWEDTESVGLELSQEALKAHEDLRTWLASAEANYLLNGGTGDYNSYAQTNPFLEPTGLPQIKDPKVILGRPSESSAFGDERTVADMVSKIMDEAADGPVRVPDSLPEVPYSFEADVSKTIDRIGQSIQALETALGKEKIRTGQLEARVLQLETQGFFASIFYSLKSLFNGNKR